MLSKNAYAKINLTLDVLGKRPDGYHEVKMIMQSISLGDTLHFDKSQNKGVRLEIKMNDNAPDKTAVPVSDDNLICRAINYMLDKYNPDGGVDVVLEKNIPVAAGLAGGSADAAASIRAVNELFELGLSDDELCDIGVKFGADIPFCIMGGCMLSEGIGERLTRLNKIPTCNILVAKPPIFVSTAGVYTAYDEVAEGVCHPDTEGMLDAINSSDLGAFAGGLRNVLEEVTIREHPVISEIKDKMLKSGALNSIMSGSGPSVFGIFDDDSALDEALSDIKNMGIKEVYACEPKY